MWIKDPSTKRKSVSLTMLVVSFLAVVAAGALQLTGKVASAGIFTEVLYSCSALYFGRRLNISGKVFASDSPDKGSSNESAN